MRNIPYWLNIGSILHQYGCATREPYFVNLPTIGKAYGNWQFENFTREKYKLLND